MRIKQKLLVLATSTFLSLVTFEANAFIIDLSFPEQSECIDLITSNEKQDIINTECSSDINQLYVASYYYTGSWPQKFPMGSEYNVTKDLGKAYDWFSKSASQGNLQSLNSLGYYYAEGINRDKNYDKAYEYFLLSANNGNEYAKYNLGLLYSETKWKKYSHRNAMKWFKESASTGLGLSMASIANMYYRGHGVIKNTEKAFTWWLEAAESGHSRSQLIVARLYLAGNIVKKDPVQYEHWLLKSGFNGKMDAQKDLSILYFDNKFGTNDHVKSYAWASIVLEKKKNDLLENIIINLKKSMNSDELKEAQLLISRYKKQIKQNKWTSCKN